MLSTFSSVPMNTNDKLLANGFDLKSVTWGYRDRFVELIDQLYRDKLLGEDSPEVTECFFSMMKKVEMNHLFDHLLMRFLEVLKPGANWIMRIPVLFSDWCGLASQMADHNLGYGVKYFDAWENGGFGRTPNDVLYVVGKVRYLNRAGMDIGIAFLESFKELADIFTFREIDVFVEYALKLYHNHPKNAISFLSLKTKTSRCYAESILTEARLADIKGRMLPLITSICAGDIKISDMSVLDADELIECGFSVIAYRDLFCFPARVSVFEKAEENRGWYMFAALTAASVLYFKGFALVHGSPRLNRAADFISHLRISPAIPAANLFVIAETCRIIKACLQYFSGARALAAEVINIETGNQPGFEPSFPDLVLRGIIRKYARLDEKLPESIVRTAEIVESLIENSNSFEDTGRNLCVYMKNNALPDGLHEKLYPLAFFPDMQYPAEILSKPPDAADLHGDDDQSGASDDRDENEEQRKSGLMPVTDTVKGEKEGDAQLDSGYFYDEWNHLEKEYYEKWCIIKERRPSGQGDTVIADEVNAQIMNARKTFEMIRPDLAGKEKHLQSGDDINMSLFMDFLSEHKAGMCPEVNFYEKPLIKKRDIAVAVLIDVSGSTGEKCYDSQTVLELERNSAFIIAEGLSVLGDDFALYGFSGHGRENADFLIFKDFEEDWDESCKQRLYGASPCSSTRMGVAIRHTGYKLRGTSAKKKILIVITDGKPMDDGYDNVSRYAQHDVRKANEENQVLGIDSFCLSNEENKIEDLDIMFPRGRYVILREFTELPNALSKFYISITR